MPVFRDGTAWKSLVLKVISENPSQNTVFASVLAIQSHADLCQDLSLKYKTDTHTDTKLLSQTSKYSYAGHISELLHTCSCIRGLIAKHTKGNAKINATWWKLNAIPRESTIQYILPLCKPHPTASEFWNLEENGNQDDRVKFSGPISCISCSQEMSHNSHSLMPNVLIFSL